MNDSLPNPEPGIAAVLAARFSPNQFDGTPVAPEMLGRLIEAARWAPSSYNEQPWAFVGATSDDAAAFERLLDLLTESNRTWAATAGALLVTAARRERRRDGLRNAHAWYDVGQAVAHLTVEATSNGLYVHQMEGFNPGEARHALGIPSGYDPVTAVAIGRPARGEAEAAAGARSRRDVAVLFHPGRWRAGDDGAAA